MTDPLITLGMDVRSFGMALLVAERLTALVAAWAASAIVAALSLNCGATRAAATIIAMLCLNCAATRTTATIVAALYLSWAAVRRRTARGDVSAADLRRGATLATAASARRMPATSASLLGKCRQRQNQKHCKQTR
jgi:hypothetical protein